MCECVIANLMPFGKHALHKTRVRFRVGADDEERRRRMLRLQDVENFGRPFRIGAVVKR